MRNDSITLNELHPSKESLDGIIRNLTLPVVDGEINPIQRAAHLDFIIKACEKAKDQIKPFVIEELEKDKSRKDYFGYNIEVGEAGVRYDFSNCNDPVYKELQEKLTSIQNEVKARENYLKAIVEKETIVTTDGEMVSIYPPAKKSSTVPKFSLK